MLVSYIVSRRHLLGKLKCDYTVHVCGDDAICCPLILKLCSFICLFSFQKNAAIVLLWFSITIGAALICMKYAKYGKYTFMIYNSLQTRHYFTLTKFMKENLSWTHPFFNLDKLKSHSRPKLKAVKITTWILCVIISWNLYDAIYYTIILAMKSIQMS